MAYHSSVTNTGKEVDISLPGWNRPLASYDVQTQYSAHDYGWEEHRMASRNEQASTHPDGYCVLDQTREWSQLRRTQLELSIMLIMNAITDKPHWEGKIHDTTVRQRWAEEIKRQLAAADTRHAEHSRELRNGPFYWGDATDEKCAQFIIEELLHKSENFPGFTTVLGLGGADVIKCDSLVPEDFREKVALLIRPLEEGPIDWHPGRENSIRDLVHPSMFPLCYGKTLFSEQVIPCEKSYMFAGQGRTIPRPDATDNYSNEFQWLPAEVRGNYQAAVFDSYINNLPVAHEELYAALGELVMFSLPLWEQCIATQSENAPRRVPCHDEETLWIVDDSRTETVPPYMETVSSVSSTPDNPRQYLQNRGGTKWHTHLWEEVKPVLVWPEPTDFTSWQATMNKDVVRPKIDLALHMARSGLQVIVKISSIHLSPENPSFNGGSMHVEGMANEHICATSIFYYDSENVEPAQIAFRGGAHMGDCQYGQDDYRCLEHVFGTSLSHAPATQQYATVKTPQGRLLAFSNVFQHQLQPFKLIDKTKPGHRKMVVLWLVNPQKRIISTAHVPPQQPDAYLSMINEVQRDFGSEAASRIRSERAAPLSEDEAKTARLRLMAERKQEQQDHDIKIRSYNFCEH